MKRFFPDARIFSLCMAFSVLVIPGCPAALGKWAAVGSLNTPLLIFSAVGIAFTLAGLTIWAFVRNHNWGRAQGRAEKMMSSVPAVGVVGISSYNAIIEEVMYRGIYLAALMHHVPVTNTVT